MEEIILKAENISKQYRLGTVGTKSLQHDLNRWYHKVRGKEDPYLKIGAVNDRSLAAEGEYVWALNNINFEVRRGEVLGIIGKNGAGKSTLLKILSRVTSPTTGSIKTKGRIASLLEVGTGFHPELTGRENIYLNGAILGMSRAEITSKIDEIVEFSGCQMYIDTPTKRYSSGMTVRLAFAVAAHLEPDILVVDEVLAVGDAEFQKEAIGKMQDISSGEGRTVLFVSHNMASIKNLCNRAILLKNGNITTEGSVLNVVEQYLNLNDSQDLDYTSSIKNINNVERSGSNILRIQNVQLVFPDGFYTPKTGKPLEFKFNLENSEMVLLRDVEFDFRIDDAFGNRLLWFSTSVFKPEQETLASTISFKIPKLPLNRGIYVVSTTLSVKGERSDWARNAFKFAVDEGYFYESLIVVPTEQSKLLVDYLINYN